MTVAEAIYAVLDGSGISTDDSPVRRRFIYNEIRIANTELVKQELNKYRLWDGTSAQTLECITLERRDASSCIDCPTGKYLLRSKEPLPAMIETDHGISITNVYFMNGVSIPQIKKEDWINWGKRRFNLPDKVGFFLTNNFLNVVGYEADVIDVDVEGFFHEPETIERMNLKNADCAADQKCKAVFEYDFKGPSHLQRRVIEIARAVVFRKLGIPLDENNNAKFDPNVESKK